MKDTIILGSILLLIIAGFFILKRFNRNKPAVDDHHDHGTEDGVCCGKHTNCAKGYDNSNLYFDDEELDRFKGAKAEEYSEDDAEEFRNISFLNLNRILFPKKNGRYMLDLVEANRQILINSGIKEENIDASDICTCCNCEDLHSHRATKGKRANLAALIELKK